ncbi:MAG: response regulator [Thiomicrospira sp.]|nr:response regulator [Thiomicrospira sp.]
MKRFLIADDSKASRLMLQALLQKHLAEAFETQMASNGDEAVAAYLQYRPDLVFLDLTMPVKSGMEALREIIAADERAKVVIITADTQKITHDKALQAGAIDFINKPLQDALLKRKLEVWL